MRPLSLTVEMVVGRRTREQDKCSGCCDCWLTKRSHATAAITSITSRGQNKQELNKHSVVSTVSVSARTHAVKTRHQITSYKNIFVIGVK